MKALISLGLVILCGASAIEAITAENVKHFAECSAVMCVAGLIFVIVNRLKS